MYETTDETSMKSPKEKVTDNIVWSQFNKTRN